LNAEIDNKERKFAARFAAHCRQERRRFDL
jgi:hypothetical protein